MVQRSKRVNVILTRIISPTEFWITIPTDDRNEQCPYNNTDFDQQKTYREYLQWIKDRDEYKCHLAFLIPIDSVCWSMTAIDKFKMYAKHFEKYAITIPPTVHAPTESTAVILWGLIRQESEHSDDDEEKPNYVWRNINLQMVFQGVARSVVHIKHLSFNSTMSWPKGDVSPTGSLLNSSIDAKNGKIPPKRVDRWLPAQQCRAIEFTGTPVFIDNNLSIYVQEWENQECIKYMSEVLTEWHRKRFNSPKKCWYEGDRCVALRTSDLMFHRAEIQRVYVKQQKCLVQWVDFGYTEVLHFEELSTHIDFDDIPIQVMKCHLSNVAPISEEQTKRAKEFCDRLIYDRLCIIYVHDNIDIGQTESNACNIQSLNAPLDLSSLLISLGLVQHNAHSYHTFDQVTRSAMDLKRIRSASDAPLIKNSSDLETYKDFKEFFRLHKAINPKDVANNTHVNNYYNNNHYDEGEDDYDDEDDDDESRTFELFEPPSKNENSKHSSYKMRTIPSVTTPHSVVDRITGHFKLMIINESAFNCRCMYIVDPVTLLIQLPEMQPLNIDRISNQPECISLDEYAPVIVNRNFAWRRGIVWEKLSTNKYRILFVDTLQTDEVSQNCIRKCPTEDLGTFVPYAKVHLYKIKPNDRIRANEICSMLEAMLIGKDLFAKAIVRHDDGVPEIKLYELKDAKRTVYHDLIKQNIFKRIEK